MSEFELEYLIQLRSEDVFDVWSILISMQIAVCVAIYYLHGIQDRGLRHAIFFSYSVTLIFSMSKIIIDFLLIGAYADMLSVHAPKGLYVLPEWTSWAFLGTSTFLGFLLWGGTFYFLYRHEFTHTSHLKIEASSPPPKKGTKSRG